MLSRTKTLSLAGAIAVMLPGALALLLPGRVQAAGDRTPPPEVAQAIDKVLDEQAGAVGGCISAHLTKDRPMGKVAANLIINDKGQLVGSKIVEPAGDGDDEARGDRGLEGARRDLDVPGAMLFEEVALANEVLDGGGKEQRVAARQAKERVCGASRNLGPEPQIEEPRDFFN